MINTPVSMKWLPWFLALVMMIPPGIVAQEENEIEPSEEALHAILSCDAYVHGAPAGRIVGVVRASEDVEVIGISPSGWVRIRNPRGKGWVDRRFLQAPPVNFGPRTFTLAESTKKAPCFPDISQCPLIGCADPTKPDALMNRVKHGPPSPPLRRLPLQAFTVLQRAADQLVGQAAHPDAQDRALLRHLNAAGVAVGEGSLVAITGFIVGDPHPNTGESVNCNLTDAPENDIHISIATGAGQTEFRSIVVEIIPQQRDSGWSRDALRQVRDAHRRVVVQGQLFYDNPHRVNSNPQNPVGGQPKRFSLWEVHPVTAFYVCTSGNCDVNDQSQWTKLEDVQFPLQ